MARGLNRAELIGYVGKDIEIRSTNSGTVVANFQIATTERFKEKSNKLREHTEWHNITAFGRLGEIVRDYVKKGSLLFVEGKLRTRTWEDKQTGQKRSKTSIEVTRVDILSSNGKDIRPTGEGDGADATEYTADDSFSDETPF